MRNVLLFLFYLLPAVLGLLLSRYLVGQMYTLPTVTYASIPYTVAAVGAAGLYTAVLLDRLAFDRRITGRPVMSRILAPLLPTRPRTPYLRLGSSMPVPEVKRRIRLTRLIVEWVTLSWPAPLFWPVLISYLSASVVEALGSSPTAGFHVAAVAAFSISGLIYTLYHEL